MSIIFSKDSDEVVGRIQNDVKSELDSSNPWLKSGFVRAIAKGLGRRIYATEQQEKKALRQCFMDTATDEYLRMWGVAKNLTPYDASVASGSVLLTGTVGSTATAGQTMLIGELEYELQSDATVAAISKSVSTLTRSGTTALCTTNDDHDFASGVSITISGVTNDTNWNGTTRTITVTGAKTFTFDVSSSLAATATGTILAGIDGVVGSVESSDTGVTYNQDSGTRLTLQSPATGIDSTAGVTWDALTGGRAIETDTEYRERIIDRWQNPQTPFNNAQIAATIKAIAGNTRVWVHRVTPAVGQVTAYFVRDGDTSIIPSASEIAAAQAAIEALSPSNTDTADIFIGAPTGITVDTTLTTISPDTISMRTAVKNQIDSFFRGDLDEGESMTLDALKAKIQQTYDETTGEKLSSFVLAAPTEDQRILAGQIAIIGTVTIAGVVV